MAKLIDKVEKTLAKFAPGTAHHTLQRNRLNVGISRGKWAAYLVHSPALRDYLPHTPQGLAKLSGFIRLTTSPVVE